MSTTNSHNEILQHIEKYGIQDKDGVPRKKAGKKKPLYQKTRRSLRRVVDLHGKTRKEAVAVVRRTFLECKRTGVDTLLVIHGVGNNSDPAAGPVLKKTVRAMLQRELGAHIRDFRTALPRDGGDGATLVRLK
jgi:DNA-nicking Smr family endonuclease